MDLPDIQVVVQWRASCNLMTLWQRLGRGTRDRTYTAVAIFLVEKEHFDEEREKKLVRRQRVRKTKKQNSPLQPITNKRVRTMSSTSRRAAVDNVEGFSCSSDESETEELTSMALMTPTPVTVREDENSKKRETDLKISQLRHRYSTTVSAPRKKKSDPLEPAMDDLINAQSRKLGCRRIPIQAYLEMTDICTCHCQLVGVDSELLIFGRRVAFHPTDCRPELPSGCPRCGENESSICCDIETPDYFRSFQIPPLKIDRAINRSRIEPVKSAKRMDADTKLINALEDWREETTKTCYGESALLDFGPSLIMSTTILDRIVNCVQHHKISTIQDLARETRWDEVSRYGTELLALIQATHPTQTNDSETRSESSTAKKI
jgi:hypothetical protein